MVRLWGGGDGVQAVFGSVLEHEGFCVSAHEFQQTGYVLVFSVWDSAVVARRSVTVSAYVEDWRRRISLRAWYCMELVLVGNQGGGLVIVVRRLPLFLNRMEEEWKMREQDFMSQ